MILLNKLQSLRIHRWHRSSEPHALKNVINLKFNEAYVTSALLPKQSTILGWEAWKPTIWFLIKVSRMKWTLWTLAKSKFAVGDSPKNNANILRSMANAMIQQKNVKPWDRNNRTNIMGELIIKKFDRPKCNTCYNSKTQTEKKISTYQQLLKMKILHMQALKSTRLMTFLIKQSPQN